MTLLILVQAALAALVALAYLAGLSRLRRSSTERLEALPGWRVLCFAAGLATALAAVAALEGPGRKLLYLASLQQVLIGDVAALLLVLGLTRPLLRPFARVPLLGRLSLLASPPLALPLWLGNAVAWHVPAIYEFAFEHRSLMILQHLLFACLGIAVWASLLGPRRYSLGQSRRLAYLFCWRLIPVIAGNFAIWWPYVIYPHYVHTDTAYALSPLADQGIAGAIVFGESALMILGLLVWLYLLRGRGQAPQSLPSAREEPALATAETSG
ncbi:MAG TPA: cytochrome c oxidase assembly protein [Solirubrobacteraceae bacterium]